MPEQGTPDRFDALRRAWIAHHQGWSTIQRRRAEQLDRRIRARQREQSCAAPDPHDDTRLPPLWLRTAHSPAGQLELTLVLTVGVTIPLGLLAGYAIKAVVTKLIPDVVRGYPVAALLWAAAGLGALTVLLVAIINAPGASCAQVATGPWVCVQIVAAPAVAGILGIAEGWLAIPGSRRWFPHTPPRQPLSTAQAIEILGGYDLTGPGLLEAQRLNPPGERTR